MQLSFDIRIPPELDASVQAGLSLAECADEIDVLTRMTVVYETAMQRLEAERGLPEGIRVCLAASGSIAAAEFRASLRDTFAMMARIVRMIDVDPDAVIVTGFSPQTMRALSLGSAASGPI